MPAALIVGAGSGISAAFARALGAKGYKVGLASRHRDHIEALAREVGGIAISADAADEKSVAAAFEACDRELGPLDAVLYNAAQRVRGPIAELDPAAVKQAVEITAFGGFLVGQKAAQRMLPRGRGTIMFTGASAGVKGYAESATFAMGKFALRGLAQSMARELHPKGIHVAHFVIDGGVLNPARGRSESPGASDSLLDPDAIAQTYLSVLEQPRSAWSWEVEIRPWTERF